MVEKKNPRLVLHDLAEEPEWIQQRLIHELSAGDKRGLRWTWKSFERADQVPPTGDWSTWLVQAGRGFGKTRIGAEWVLARAREQPGCRIALVGASMEEVRRIMIDGESGIRSIAPPGDEPKWCASRGELSFRGGAVAAVYSGASGEGLRGPQHHYAWADEVGKWTDPADAWSNLQLGLRLGDRPRALVTTTPGNDDLLRAIIAEPGTVVTGGHSADNLDLPEDWHRRMEAIYRGTRLGRRELQGELVGEAEEALWTRKVIEDARVRDAAWGAPVRVVVGVDPSVTAAGDACGIVVCGRVADGRLLVLADCSVKGLSPAGWAGKVADAAAAWGADKVVAEANNGGDLVLQVLGQADFHLPVKKVLARLGKVARAEPMAMLFENKKAGFQGEFAALEEELCHLTTRGYEGKGSPDRADAMVWALHELSRTERGGPRLRGL